jgi:exonuclease III
VNNKKIPKPPKRPLSRPTLLTISINIEGLSSDKENLLSNICKENNCDALLLQETHRGIEGVRPRVEGMKLILERPHDKYGSAVFVRENITVDSACLTCTDDIEILTVEINKCTITSVYKPPLKPFYFEEPENYNSQSIKIVMGDFNCHSTSWGYQETDENGERLESWAEGQRNCYLTQSNLRHL